jgi:hypothetical protein
MLNLVMMKSSLSSVTGVRSWMTNSHHSGPDKLLRDTIYKGIEAIMTPTCSVL